MCVKQWDQVWMMAARGIRFLLPRQVRKSCSVVHLPSSGVTGMLALNLAPLMTILVVFQSVTHCSGPPAGALPSLVFSVILKVTTQPSQRRIGKIHSWNSRRRHPACTDIWASVSSRGQGKQCRAESCQRPNTLRVVKLGSQSTGFRASVCKNETF